VGGLDVGSPRLGLCCCGDEIEGVVCCIIGCWNMPTISVSMGCLVVAGASRGSFSSIFCFFARGAPVVEVAVLSLGSLGLRVFLGTPSSMGFPSGPGSFFLRCRFGLLSGAVPLTVVGIIPFGARAAVLDASAEVAALDFVTPSCKSEVWGCRSGGWATLMVSECCGVVGGGGDSDDDDDWSEAASSTCMPWAKPSGMAIAWC